MTDLIIAFCFLCIGAGIATMYWCRVMRQHIAWTREQLDWWYEHSGKGFDSARRMSDVARNAIDINELYRKFLDGKIIIDPAGTKQRKDKPS